MTPRHSLFALLVVVMVSCTGPTDAERIGARAGEGGEGEGEYEGEGVHPGVPDIGEPCTEDLCASGQILRVCTAHGTFGWDVDCGANQGICARRGQREMCVADGWDCETRCLDEDTLQICWSNLRVETVECDGDSVCDPDGVFDPLTGDISGICVGNDPGGCSCDSFFSDPAQPVCCDEGCACDHDCEDGFARCGQPDDPDAASEECACDTYYTDPTQPLCCDGGCACDTDCDAEHDYEMCGWESNVPEEWSCELAVYADGDGCDCECGAPDPDCDDPVQVVFNCVEGQVCDYDGSCRDAGGR